MPRQVKFSVKLIPLRRRLIPAWLSDFFFWTSMTIIYYNILQTSRNDEDIYYSYIPDRKYGLPKATEWESIGDAHFEDEYDEQSLNDDYLYINRYREKV